MTEPTQTDQRLMMRESFARYLALLVVLLVVLLIERTIPGEIDYNNPGQMLYLGQMQGAIFGMALSACTFFFFIQATEKAARDGQRQGDAPAPLLTMPPPKGDQSLTVEVKPKEPWP